MYVHVMRVGWCECACVCVYATVTFGNAGVKWNWNARRYMEFGSVAQQSENSCQISEGEKYFYEHLIKCYVL